MNKIQFLFRVWKNRILTLRKDVLYPALHFLCSIFFIELFSSYNSTNSNLQNNLWQIYLKICYSFTSATIFYFIVVHIPKERRKVKLYRYIKNKSAAIHLEVRSLIQTVNQVAGTSLNTESSLEDFEDALIKIVPKQKVTSMVDSGMLFNDWYEYLDFRGNKIKNNIRELLQLNESIDAEFLLYLTFIDDEVSKNFIFYKIKFDNTDLVFWASPINHIVKYTNEMLKVKDKAYSRYLIEYEEDYGKIINKLK